MKNINKINFEILDLDKHQKYILTKKFLNDYDFLCKDQVGIELSIFNVCNQLYKYIELKGMTFDRLDKFDEFLLIKFIFSNNSHKLARYLNDYVRLFLKTEFKKDVLHEEIFQNFNFLYHIIKKYLLYNLDNTPLRSSSNDLLCNIILGKENYYERSI